MKTALIGFIVWMAVMGIIFLAVSFANLTVNPVAWTPSARDFFAILSVLFLVITAAVVVSIETE